MQSTGLRGLALRKTFEMDIRSQSEKGPAGSDTAKRRVSIQNSAAQESGATGLSDERERWKWLDR